MKVLIDVKIPYLKGVIETLADEVVYTESADFTPALVREADALFVRTRTLCDRALLSGSSVQFIATATIGFDHIDTTYCEIAGIAWANAPGCNAGGVEQYVHSALLLLERERGLTLAGATLGVVGVGHVGTRVAAVGCKLGMHVMLCDPPRADREGSDGFFGLDELAAACDIISFHTPLTTNGRYPTYHLANDSFFHSLQKRPFIINTSRGEVVDTAALRCALTDGRVADAVIDVWEYEPTIDRELLRRVYLGTPHIAGYSAEGKANATRMALQAFCRHFALPQHFEIVLPPPEIPVIEARSETDAQLATYDPRRDSRMLKQSPELFEQLRGTYNYRREAGAYTFCIQS